MSKPISLAVAGAALLLAGCTTTYRQGPVDVTRYHLGTQLERTSVTVEPMATTGEPSPEFQLYADAVARELQNIGFVPSMSESPAGYIAAVDFRRGVRGSFKEAPPFSIGLGGGSYSGRRGGGVGLGGGVSVGLGGKTRDIIASELWVQLRRRADNSTVWEGRAVTENVSGAVGSDPRDTAARLANAIFKGFPGESGVTITVK